MEANKGPASLNQRNRRPVVFFFGASENDLLCCSDLKICLLSELLKSEVSRRNSIFQPNKPEKHNRGT